MRPFWTHSPLDRMTHEQWESLCDGCAKCCLQKLEDADTREIHYTHVVCRYLDPCSGRCSDYANRSRRVPNCVPLTPEVLSDPYWLPETCAYRCLAEGRPLPDWHPLITGDPGSVMRAGHSVLGRVVSETEADDLEMHLIDWVH